MKYQSNFSFKKADEAIDAVLDFLIARMQSNGWGE